MLNQSRCQHSSGMRFERSVRVVPAEDDDRVPRSIAGSRGTQAPPGSRRINSRNLLFVA